MLIDDIMSGKFTFSPAKEAMVLGQKKVEKKHKRTMLDTSIVDDHPVEILAQSGGPRSHLG